MGPSSQRAQGCSTPQISIWKEPEYKFNTCSTQRIHCQCPGATHQHTYENKKEYACEFSKPLQLSISLWASCMHNAKKHTTRPSPSGTYSSYCNIHPHMKITGIHMSVFSKSHEVITICFGMWADQELLSKQYHCASICIIAGSRASGFCSK